eukprot:3479864-Ditylum_brightwellii.AAC.1
MVRSLPSVEEILTDFPQPLVPKVSGEPSYEPIHLIHKILKENTASVHSNLEGDRHGHLALVLTPTHYQQVTGHIYVTLMHPGSHPPNPRAFILQHNLQVQWDAYYSQLHA